MTFKEEWQLVAHKPKLNPAEALIALAIARRLPQGAESVRIPIRTLAAESVGLYSRNTAAKALERLEEKGVIEVLRDPTKKRTANRVKWVLACPEGCNIDHANGNKKLSAMHSSRALDKEQPITTRSGDEHLMHSSEDALRISNKEREHLEIVRKVLQELPNPTETHSELSQKLNDPVEAREVSVLVSSIIQGSDSSAYNYLKAIVTNSPLRLMPRALKAANNPEDLALRELADKRRERERRNTEAYFKELEEAAQQAAPPPPELRAALGLVKD